jgi:signal transduction histidine kinase
VVEDNTLMQHTIRGLLLAKNYSVHATSNGEEALEVLRTAPVDLIICDIMMPRMDGYTLFNQVQVNPELAHIPFVFLSALVSTDEIIRGRSLGADEYITKPFEPRNFLALVQGKVKRARLRRSLYEEVSEEFRQQIIHTLSHEFRTPLVAISAGTELLLDTPFLKEEGKTQELLLAIRRGGERLERLVTDFMLVQQIESGVALRSFESRSVKASVTDLVQCVKGAVATLGDNEQRRIFVEEHLVVSQAEVRFFAKQIHELTLKLLSNALKFSIDKPITVFLETEDEEVFVRVIDQGNGFDLKRVGEALKLFGQLDREHFEQQGGGLGLTIADRLARIHGGNLSFRHLEVAGLHGFEVTLRLPLI